MAIERGNESAPAKLSPVQIRENRVHSYMRQFNQLPEDKIGSELSQIIEKARWNGEGGRMDEETKRASTSGLRLVDQKTVTAFEEKIDAQRSAEDAFVALLYDLQYPLRKRNMHIIPPELPKLLQILEDTKFRRESQYESERSMLDPRDQAVLFLTQTYFYDDDRTDGNVSIPIDKKSLGDIDVQKLIYKVNKFLPEGGKFTIQSPNPEPEREPELTVDFSSLFPSTSKEEPKKEITMRKRHIVPKTSEELQKEEELEEVLYWTVKNLSINLDAEGGSIQTVPPKMLLLEKDESRLNVTEKAVFGVQSKGKAAFFSLLSRISPESKKQIVDLLLGEKDEAKRREMIDRFAAAGNKLLSEVISPETNQELSDAFAQDVLGEDLDMKNSHVLLEKKAKQTIKGRDKKSTLIRELTVEAAERLFLLQRATVLGTEIREEILKRREAMRSARPIPIDAEGKSNPQDIQKLLDRINEYIESELPVDPNSPIVPYELNVQFRIPQEVEEMMSHLICGGGKLDNFDIFQMGKVEMQEAVYSLAIEKWSHQAREQTDLRKLARDTDKEQLGHFMPYAITKLPTKDGPGIIGYYQHHKTINEKDKKKRDLFVISGTELSIPVTLPPIEIEGQNMRIEYVYGLSGQIKGKKVQI